MNDLKAYELDGTPQNEPAMHPVAIKAVLGAASAASRSEHRQRFLEALTPENIIKNTKNRLIYSVPFRRVFEDGIRHYRVEFTRMELDNGEINIVTGFRDVTDEAHPAPAEA